MSSPSQEALDRMFGLDLEAWTALRSGRLPSTITRMMGSAGCLRFLAVPFGLIGGGLIGFSTHPVAARSIDITQAGWIALCAVLGAFALAPLVRSLMGDRLERLSRDVQQAVVVSEVLSLRMGRNGNGRALIADDGRSFRMLPVGESVEIEGTFRLYYVDLGTIAKWGGRTQETLFALGLERV